MEDARSPEWRQDPRCRSIQQRRATSPPNTDTVIPVGLVWRRWLASHLVEPMPPLVGLVPDERCPCSIRLNVFPDSSHPSLLQLSLFGHCICNQIVFVLYLRFYNCYMMVIDKFYFWMKLDFLRPCRKWHCILKGKLKFNFHLNDVGFFVFFMLLNVIWAVRPCRDVLF